MISASLTDPDSYDPVIYGQTFQLPSIETQVLIEVTNYALRKKPEHLDQALAWLTRLQRMAYPQDGRPACEWMVQGGPSLAALSGAPWVYCERNGLSDDAFIVVGAVTQHRADGADGEDLIEGAIDALRRMRQAHPACACLS